MSRATLDLERAGGRVWDAVVVGAGPAGAVAARALAAGRARVLLVERKAFPRPKVCGACLNVKALAVLNSAGLAGALDDLGGVGLTGFEVRLGGRAARFPLPGGLALPRDVLDAALADAAVAAGAEFLPATGAAVLPDVGPVRRVRLDQAGGRSTTAEARVVVAAAGLGSTCLAREPGLRTDVAPGARVGAGCVVDEAPAEFAPGTIYMAVGRSGYVGLVRLAGGVLNVAAAFDRGFVRASGGPAGAAAAVLDEAGFPAVPALDGADWIGTPPLTRRTRPPAGHRLFLVGDAAGYVEPFTGEGMGAALVSGQSVAPLALRGITAWDPALSRAWARLYHRRVGRQQLVVRALAAAARRPWVARGVFACAARSRALSGALIRRVNEPPVLLEAT